MNIAEHMRQELDALVGHEGLDTESSYLRFQERTRCHPSAEADRVAPALLGEAAYVLGAHYATQRNPQAQRWLHIAVEYDCGQATLELARWYETQSVDEFNVHAKAMQIFHAEDLIDVTPPPIPDPGIHAAAHWYDVAKAYGFDSAIDDPRPLHALDHQDTCPTMLRRQAEHDSDVIRREADAHALEQSIQARKDVRAAQHEIRSIMDNARAELAALAVKNQRLIQEHSRLRVALIRLVTRAGLRHPDGQRPTARWIPFGRSHARAALQDDLAACLRVLDILAQPEHVERPPDATQANNHLVRNDDATIPMRRPHIERHTTRLAPAA